MTVIVMEPARALSADIGSYIFGAVKGSGRITTVGVKMNKNRLGKNAKEAMLCPLSTKWHKHQCHWPRNIAERMFGFNEVM